MKWILKKISVKDLKEYPKNPRQLTKKGLDNLEKSIKKFGVAEPPVLNTDLTICGGHGRKKILERLNIEFVDCYIPEKKLTQKEFEELNIRLNKNIAGEFDFDILANEFETEELIDWGFEESELGMEFFPTDDNADDVPEIPKVALSKLGDIFLIDGKHRILCGDSTKAEDVEKLMDGKKAQVSFQSPPYNVSWNIGYKSKSKYKSSDDNLSEYRRFIVEFTTLALAHANEVFVNIQFLSNNKKEILEFMYELRNNFKDIFYWKKLSVQPAMAYNVVNSQVEVIILFGQQNKRNFGTKKFRGTLSNYIETKSATGENKNTEIHNATYPVALPKHFLVNAYSESDLCLDLFLGTGTTLVACEQTKRICYGMEIDPIYIDVILKRYYKLYPNADFKCLNRQFDFKKLFDSE